MYVCMYYVYNVLTVWVDAEEIGFLRYFYTNVVCIKRLVLMLGDAF